MRGLPALIVALALFGPCVAAQSTAGESAAIEQVLNAIRLTAQRLGFPPFDNDGRSVDPSTATIVIRNTYVSPVEVYFKGPASHHMTVAAHQTGSVVLPAGSYEFGARYIGSTEFTDAGRFMPYYSRRDIVSGRAYSAQFIGAGICERSPCIGNLGPL